MSRTYTPSSPPTSSIGSPTTPPPSATTSTARGRPPGAASISEGSSCQCVISVHYVAPAGHSPLSLRLDLPESWLAEPDRLDRAGVPEEARRTLSKGQIALELLDQARGEGLPGKVALADSDYRGGGSTTTPAW